MIYIYLNDDTLFVLININFTSVSKLSIIENMLQIFKMFLKNRVARRGIQGWLRSRRGCQGSFFTKPILNHLNKRKVPQYDFLGRRKVDNFSGLWASRK